MDEVRIHPETLAGDPFPAAAAEQDQDDHPCCCLEGWVFMTFEDEHGEEREASYRCRRCVRSSFDKATENNI